MLFNNTVKVNLPVRISRSLVEFSNFEWKNVKPLCEEDNGSQPMSYTKCAAPLLVPLWNSGYDNRHVATCTSWLPI